MFPFDIDNAASIIDTCVSFLNYNIEATVSFKRGGLRVIDQQD